MTEGKFPTGLKEGTWKPSAELKGVYELELKQHRTSQLSLAQKDQLNRAVKKVREKIASLKVRA